MRERLSEHRLTQLDSDGSACTSGCHWAAGLSMSLVQA